MVFFAAGFFFAAVAFLAAGFLVAVFLAAAFWGATFAPDFGAALSAFFVPTAIEACFNAFNLSLFRRCFFATTFCFLFIFFLLYV